MKTRIINVKVVLPDGIKENSCVTIENGIITEIGENPVGITDTVDGNGGYLLPGFIDIHCHGGNGRDFMDASETDALEIAEFHLAHGTTTLVPTTMTDDFGHVTAVLDMLKRLYRAGRRTTLCGAHLEGPWLSPAQCGAQSVVNMENPEAEKLKRLKEKYPFINRVSVAPELKGAMETGRVGKSLGIVMSAAHTDADFDIVMQAADNGYTLMTHLYSGMNGVRRKNAYRVAGAVEAGLLSDDLFVEIIADGKHLPHGLLKLVYKCKGADKICLITDAMRASGLKDGEKSVLGRRDGGVSVIVEDGVAKMPDRQNFAGSVATADRLIRTMISAGTDIASVSKMASATPAKVMGLNDRGVIARGKKADLVLMDEEYRVKRVIVDGLTEYEKN